MDHTVSQNFCVTLNSKYLYYSKNFFVENMLLYISMKHVNFIIFRVTINILKYALKNFFPLAVMYRKTCVCRCRRIFSPTYNIFSTAHSTLDMNLFLLKIITIRD